MFDIHELQHILTFIKKVEPVETNIVIFELDKSYNEDTFLQKLHKKGIKIISMGENKLRMVTHLNYTHTMHDFLLDTLKSL